MFKTETHMHVSEVSPCAKLSAKEMVELYHKAGYKTLFISDHIYKELFGLFGNILWREKIEWFLNGYRKAKATAEQYDMNVILSAEINYGSNDYLLYGIDEDFLKECPTLLNMGIEKLYNYAKERGAVIVQAHPLRDGHCSPTPEFVDGFEVINSNPRHENFSEKVLEIAQLHNKAITAGSDAHRTDDAALSGVITKTEIRTADDYIKALLSGELELITGDNNYDISVK